MRMNLNSKAYRFNQTRVEERERERQHSGRRGRGGRDESLCTHTHKYRRTVDWEKAGEGDWNSIPIDITGRGGGGIVPV